MNQLLKHISFATYLSIVFYYCRRIIHRCSRSIPGQPTGTPRKNPIIKDNTLQQAVDKLAGCKLAIPYTLDGKSFTVLSVVPKDKNDTSALDKLYQDIERFMPDIFPHTKILDDGVSPLGWFICSGKAVSDLPILSPLDVDTLNNVIHYYKCKIR